MVILSGNPGRTMIGICRHRRERIDTGFCFCHVALVLFAVLGSYSGGTSGLLHRSAPASCYHRRNLLPKHAYLSVTGMTGCNQDLLSGVQKNDGPDRNNAPPILTVGVIADIQYAPIPDGESYSGTPRFYRHSLEVARHAFEHFEREKVDLVVNLGDIIDGKCQDIELNGGDVLPPDTDPGELSLSHVLDALSSYQSGKILHTYGNHCLYNLDRPTLQDRLGIEFTKEPCGELVGYYDHLFDDRVRFVVIDGYDIATMQRGEMSSQKWRMATEILKQKNPNFEENMNSPEGLEGVDRRFVAFNGSVGPLQLDWIQNTLFEARKAKQKVIILSHQPILPESSSHVCLMWNYEEVLSILRDFSDVVVASFCGHAHKGGYRRDQESGIHFRVFEAALENRPERTYAIVDFHDDRLVVRGFGNCESAVYDFNHCQKETPFLTTR